MVLAESRVRSAQETPMADAASMISAHLHPPDPNVRVEYDHVGVQSDSGAL